ncbi:hypothetical protein, partial [Arcobacter vandammei]|uniref:hypothetical protein n=1 Tax=Arcobacter vandammei TaxID=2782243 RepID=UPI0018E064B1
MNKFQIDLINNNKQTQEIKARLELLNYKTNNYYLKDSNDLYENTDGNYSIYSLEGRSGVNKVYEYEITFVSNEKIEVEDIVDTDVKIV